MTYILVFYSHAPSGSRGRADATAGADVHSGRDRAAGVAGDIGATCIADASCCCCYGSIEIELGDGSRVRVDDGVSLVTLRRVISALRG